MRSMVNTIMTPQTTPAIARFLLSVFLTAVLGDGVTVALELEDDGAEVSGMVELSLGNIWIKSKQ